MTTKTVADLSAADLGRVVAVNGFRGRLLSIAATDDPAYSVALNLAELDGDAVACPWVKPDMPCRVEVTP